MAAPDKAAGAFRTIGELSRELDVPQHILRYWETRFPQLRPLQRAGNRRYYRPEDVTLVRRIQSLLDTEGYTIRGVQKLLGEESPKRGTVGVSDGSSSGGSGSVKAALRAIRDTLAMALKADA